MNKSQSFSIKTITLSALLFCTSFVLHAQDFLPILKYKGNATELNYTVAASDSVNGVVLLTIQLPKTYYSNKKLNKKLLKIWKREAASFCGGTFSGTPRLHEGYLIADGINPKTRERFSDVTYNVSGVSGNIICSKGS